MSNKILVNPFKEFPLFSSSLPSEPSRFSALRIFIFLPRSIPSQAVLWKGMLMVLADSSEKMGLALLADTYEVLSGEGGAWLGNL